MKKYLIQQNEITKVNEDLIKQNHQLNDLNNEKNSLMNIVAHDLKSPLNRITGLASIMEIESALSAKQQEYLRI
jgi:signal transduction histidine kinase